MSEVKILHCIRQGQIGGGESHVLDLVQNLNQNRFKSSVLSFTTGPMIDQLTNLGIPNYVIPTEFPFDFRTWGKVSKLIRNNQFNLIHIHGTRALSNCFLAATRNNIPIIYTVHGWSFHNYQNIFRRKISILAERYLCSFAKAIINVSEYNRQIGLAHIPALHSTVIQNGIDTGKFEPALNHKDIRAELKIGPDKILIGFISRMTYQKDPITLIKAFHLLQQKTENKDRFRLLMVGEGDMKGEAIKMAKELNLTASIHFENFRNDVPDILSALNIYCLPSLWEGLPLGVLEAMASEKIVVASSVDGTREVIKDGENGYLFAPGNYEQLSRLLEEGCQKNEANEKIKLNARKTIHDSFTIQKMVSKTEKVYQDVLDKNTNYFQN